MNDGDEDDKRKQGDGEGARWLDQIERAQKTPGMVKWSLACDVVRKTYLYENSVDSTTKRYSILWSNIETLGPAVYSQPPKAVVQRRWKDRDPIGRASCEILERGTNFQFELNEFHSVFEQIKKEFLLYARGQARLYYEPVMSEAAAEEEQTEDNEGTPLGDETEDAREGGLDVGGLPPDEPAFDTEAEAITPDGPGQSLAAPTEQVTFEHVKIKFVHRDDFVHSISRTWEEVDWVAFRAYLTKDEWDKRFPEFKDNFAGFGLSDRKTNNEAIQDAVLDKAICWEIWDRTSREVLWVSPGVDEVLDRSEPYLKLEKFFPCPKPAYGTLSNDELAPRPDYVFYQDQAEEIDALTKRIAALTDALKLVGFYPGGPQGEGFPEIEKALKPGFENKMIAVRSWDAFAKGGPNGSPIVWLPVEQVATIIKECIMLRKELISDIYQITGISDIMRGDTEPDETMGAQQLKAQFGSSRVRVRSQELARFCRDVARITGEIIATQFDQKTLAKMTNIELPTRAEVQQQFQQAMLQFQAAQQQFMAQQAQQAPAGPPQPVAPPAPAQPAPQPAQPPQPPTPPQPGQPVTWDDVLEMFQDGVSRRFRLDIEADSTIEGDESRERADRNEFITAVTTLVEKWAPLLEVQPALLPVAKQVLLFGIRGFRVGRELEEVIEEAFDKLEEAAAGPKPAPAMKPEDQAKIEATRIKAAAELQKAQIDLQGSQAESQAKIADLSARQELHQTQAAAAMQQSAQLHAQETAANERKAQQDAEKHAMEMQARHAEMARSQREHEHRLQLAEREHQHKIQLAEHAHRHSLEQSEAAAKAKAKSKDA